MKEDDAFGDSGKDENKSGSDRGDDFGDWGDAAQEKKKVEPEANNDAFGTFDQVTEVKDDSGKPAQETS